MKEIEIYLDILKRLNYYLLDKRVSYNTIFYIMRDISLNDCEILSDEDGKIHHFKLYNSSISQAWMYIDKKFFKNKDRGYISSVIENKHYYMIESMNKERFDDYYKEMFRKYKLINILDV